jgi:hypothetical protein
VFLRIDISKKAIGELLLRANKQHSDVQLTGLLGALSLSAAVAQAYFARKRGANFMDILLLSRIQFAFKDESNFES